MIPYGKHYLDEDDIEAVVQVLKYGSLTQGPMIQQFENNFAPPVLAKIISVIQTSFMGSE